MFFFLYSFPIYVPTIFKSGYIDIINEGKEFYIQKLSS